MILKKYCTFSVCLLLIGFCEIYGSVKSSLTFVIDDTGSMQPEINQVKEGVDRIFNAVLESKASQIEDFVLVTFNDMDFFPFYSTKLRTKTKDRDTFKRQLAAIEVDAGFDCPEDSMSGILKGIENSQPRSTIYIYTDASAKDYRKFDEVKNLAIKKQCKLIFVLTGDCHNPNGIEYRVYQNLADATSGLVLPGLNKWSKDITQITNEIINSIQSPKTDIVTEIFPTGTGKVEFTIDENHKNTTITVIGQHPTLDVFGPNSEVIKVIMKVLIDINNVRIEQINDAKPGVYIANVKSDTNTRVKVSAGTEVTFQHGFSTFKASSIRDTTTRPLPDVESYVHIQITDGQINLRTLRIIPTEGSVIENINLNVLDKNSKLYVTKLMELPDCRFQIEIIGRDPDTNKDIRRLGPPIEPQPRVTPKPKPPKVDIIGTPAIVVDYNGNVVLTCKIDGYPQPAVIWVLEDGTEVNGQVSLVEKPYEYISYMKLPNVRSNGTYYCKAENNKNGRRYNDEDEIQINVRSPFRIISTPPAIINLKYGEKTDIVCNVNSPVPITIEWFYQNVTNGYSKLLEINTSDKYTISPDRSTIHIMSANINHIGKYACKISLPNDNRFKKNFETHLKITNLKSPQIFVSKSKVTLMAGQDLKESCSASGIPKPEFKWKFKSLSSLELVSIQLKGGDLSIPRVSYASAGTYECTATNAVGTVTQMIEVIVYGKPEIVNVLSEYKGVTGDKVLKIPCNVTGVPEPIIIWKQTDKPVISDSKITVYKSALYIKNPTEEDSNNFTCEARNKYGFASKQFEATISDFIDYIDTKYKIDDTDDGGAIYLKRGESADIRCRLPHSDPQSVRWYLNEINSKVFGSTYPIRNAQYSNDGNYTCRVNTDQGSESLNTLVDIGYKPQFVDSLQSSTIRVDWNPSKDGKLDCLVRAKPREKFEWYKNGKLVKNHLSEMQVTGWGQYVCKVENPHGTIERTFNVTSSECVINRKVDTVQKSPLPIGKTPGTWAELRKIGNDFVSLNHRETVHLACSTRGQPANNFKTQFKSRIIAECDKEDRFTVDGKTYKFEELQCNDYVNLAKILTKKSCAEHGEIIKVGFELDDGFLRVYDVCVENKKTVYTKTVMSGAYYNEALTTKNNGDIKKCQYNQQPLVKPVDVTFRPAQIATLTDLSNTVRVYEPCDDSSRVSWSEVEDAVRYLFDPEDKFILWSGASHYNNNVPRYLWKVLKFGNSLEAIVYVNNPKPDSSDIFCSMSTTTELTEVIIELSDAYTYACTQEDFVKKFKIPLSDFGMD